MFITYDRRPARDQLSNERSLVSLSVMRTRDPEAKKEQLFAAALAEFAEFGLAGARIERLARRAGISPGLVYSFYTGKEQLFYAVFDQIVELTVSGVPIDPADLPGYAARLHDASRANPDAIRFLTWYALERGDLAGRPATARAMAGKVAAVEAAQQAGAVTAALPAAQLLALVLTIAGMWTQPGQDTRDLVPEGQRRQAVIDAVTRLTAP
jgi:AcrR family transcriptional regulator